MSRTFAFAKILTTILLSGFCWLATPHNCPASSSSDTLMEQVFSVLDPYATDTDLDSVSAFQTGCLLLGGSSARSNSQCLSNGCPSIHRIKSPADHLENITSTFSIDIFPALDAIAAEMKRLSNQAQYEVDDSAESIDRYWRYYDDCDRWDVVFAKLDLEAARQSRRNRESEIVKSTSSVPVNSMDEVDRLLFQAKLDDELQAAMTVDANTGVSSAPRSFLKASFQRAIDFADDDVTQVTRADGIQVATIQIFSSVSTLIKSAAHWTANSYNTAVSWLKSTEFVVIESNFFSSSQPSETPVRLEKASPWPAISRSAAVSIAESSLWTHPAEWIEQTEKVLIRHGDQSMLLKIALDIKFNVQVQYANMRQRSRLQVDQVPCGIANRLNWLSLKVHRASIFQSLSTGEKAVDHAKKSQLESLK